MRLKIEKIKKLDGTVKKNNQEKNIKWKKNEEKKTEKIKNWRKKSRKKKD